MAIIKKFRIKSFKNLNSIIEFKNISLSYGNRLILDNINFKINEGQIFGMLGPNGVGKSSFLRSLAGLAPYGGSITYDGDENRKLSHNQRARKVAYLPQTLPQATNLVAYEAVISACRAVRHDLTRDRQHEDRQRKGIRGAATRPDKSKNSRRQCKGRLRVGHDQGNDALLIGRAKILLPNQRRQRGCIADTPTKQGNADRQVRNRIAARENKNYGAIYLNAVAQACEISSVYSGPNQESGECLANYSRQRRTTHRNSRPLCTERFNQYRKQVRNESDLRE